MAVDAGTLDADDADDAAALGAATDTRKPESSSVVQDPHRTVDAEHPWLGLASFTEETRSYFFGREQEVAELGRRVQRKLLTILFGQSGLGKTSILRAGIVPKLRPAGYCPVYVRIDYSNESPPPAEQIKEAIFRATDAHGEWTQPGVAAEGESLWEFLHHRDDVLKDSNGKTVVPLLIFDQFEEIFTLAQADDHGRERAARFIEDLADLVENRPPKALEARIDSDDSFSERFDFARADYRILIALREDYLAHLEGVKSVMPSITQNRMRLAPMTGQQALSAVIKPGGKLVSEEVAESIVRFIAGGSEIPNAEVEPSLLSLICRELNNARIAQGRNEISVDLLAGSNETILAEFYERALADQPPAVRRFIEDEMLTDSGYRESLAEERVRKAFNAAGATADALAKLVDRRLLRIEERLDLRRVELTHDVLCNVVAASRDMRHEREARDEAERQLEAQKAREAATRKALVRARQVAAVCGVLAIGAIASAIFGYQNMKRAQEAEAKALQTRQMAESARGEAEKLIVYLLDDFYQELEPYGRLDIMGDLSKRAIAYYAALPPELRTAQTERNRALALVRYGFVLRSQANLDEGEKVLSEATNVLGRLRREGDASETAAIGHALGLAARARIFQGKGATDSAATLARQAADVLQPLTSTQSRSIALRRAHGFVSAVVGFVAEGGRDEAAVKALDIARESFRSIDDLKLGDLAAAAGFVEASAGQMNPLANLGRAEQARKVGEEAMRVASQVLEKRPGHMAALRSRALIGWGLSRVDLWDLRLRKSLVLNEAVVRDWESLLKLDPGHALAWATLAASGNWRAWTLWRLGRSSEGLDVLRATMDLERRAGAGSSPALSGNLAFNAGAIAIMEADVGNRQQAATALANHYRLREHYFASLPKDSFRRTWWSEWSARFEAQVAFGAGDFAAMRDVAQASIGRLKRLEATNAGDAVGKNAKLAFAHGDSALAFYSLKDYAAAEKALREGMVFRALLPWLTLEDEIDKLDDQVLLAMALARQRRLSEAREMIEPVLAFHRKLPARVSEDLKRQLQLAIALHAAALASPTQAPGLLTEAARIVDGFPPDAARRKSVTMVRGWIVAEQQKR